MGDNHTSRKEYSTPDNWRTTGEYVTVPHVVLRTCTVAVKDIRDVEHSIEVTAETLYEAIATALAALQQDNWVGEIGQGLTTVSVLVQQPPVKHEVRMKDFPPGQPQKYARVIKTEGKGSDANLATHLLNDTHMDRFDVAVVISNDSDLLFRGQSPFFVVCEAV